MAGLRAMNGDIVFKDANVITMGSVYVADQGKSLSA